ncbi:MAG: hypothetical protein V1909_06285 [Candidatus Micrarchaeota archaeon]
MIVEILVILASLIVLTALIYKLIEKQVKDHIFVLQEPISGSTDGLTYTFREIRGLELWDMHYLKASKLDFSPIRIEMSKAPFSLGLLAATPTGGSRESFGPITKKLNDAMWSPLSIGGKVHKDFIIKSKDSKKAIEFCDKHEKGLKRLVQIAFSKLAVEVGAFQIPIKGELSKGDFKLSLIFVDGKEQKRIKEVIELAAVIAKKEGY